MYLLLLGATGSIGAPVLRELRRRGHHVVALARSEASAAKLGQAGAQVVHGDIGDPMEWLPALSDIDGVIHMACDFASPMQAIDRCLLDALLPRLASQSSRPRVVYTGGCWLFGPTGTKISDEDGPFAPLDAFAWMVPHLERVLASSEVQGLVVHPAMVYGGEGGVFRRFAREASNGAARLVGSSAVHWPLVHCDDLASLYALVVEKAPAGSSYIGSAIDGFPVARIARLFGRGEPIVVAEDAIATELGEWARGYGCDQRLSGRTARVELGWAPIHRDPEADIRREMLQ
jgi:nucleoside-diphosphate-sugar epimerase